MIATMHSLLKATPSDLLAAREILGAALDGIAELRTYGQHNRALIRAAKDRPDPAVGPLLAAFNESGDRLKEHGKTIGVVVPWQLFHLLPKAQAEGQPQQADFSGEIVNPDGTFVNMANCCLCESTIQYWNEGVSFFFFCSFSVLHTQVRQHLPFICL